MTALALPGTVPPLLARLGSDSDGERLACLRQLDRVLSRAGVSWTDLARRIEDLAPAPIIEDEEAPFVLTHWRIAVQWIIGHPAWRPSEKERDFVVDMRRFLKRKDPTPKQAAWLRAIVERLGGRVDA